MKKETYFFRDIDNLSVLKHKTEEKLGKSKIMSQYDIIKILELEEDEFKMFCENFKLNYDFLYDYIEEMKIEKGGIWKCVEIRGKNTRILVQNNGYSYPRFTGLVLENIDLF